MFYLSFYILIKILLPCVIFKSEITSSASIVSMTARFPPFIVRTPSEFREIPHIIKIANLNYKTSWKYDMSKRLHHEIIPIPP